MATVGGARLRYFEQGAGPAILLIHGFPSSIEMSFGRLLPLLPNTHRVIAVDLAGLGYSDRSASIDLSLRAQASRLLELLSQLGVERAVVVGSSMGGAVAQHMAVMAPERVERLILLASIEAGLRPSKRTQRFAKVIVLAVRLVRLPFLGPKLRVVFTKPEGGFDETWTEAKALEATACLAIPGTVDSVQRILRTASVGPAPDITAIAVPTLVVSGMQDKQVGPDVGSRIASKIPGARHVVLADCRHGLALHHPHKIAELLMAEMKGQALPVSG